MSATGSGRRRNAYESGAKSLRKRTPTPESIVLINLLYPGGSIAFILHLVASPCVTLQNGDPPRFRYRRDPTQPS